MHFFPSPSLTRTPHTLGLVVALSMSPVLAVAAETRPDARTAHPAETTETAAPDEGRVVELAPIVVTAQPADRPLAVTLDPRAPAQPIPAQDGAEVLRGVPGVNVIRKGGTDGDPVLRGMAGSRLGILVDGEQILGGCGHRMDPPTAYVFPASFDRVTVLKGPQSVLHGPGNSAGVVLFERTPEHFTVPTAGLDASATLGSFGRNDQFLDATAGAPLGRFQLTATRSAADDYTDGAGNEIHSNYERWSTRAALGWTPDERTLVELTGTLSDGEAAYADRMMDGSLFERRNLGLRVRRNDVSDTVTAVDLHVFVNAVDHVMDNYSLRPFTPTPMMPGRSASNPDRLTYGARASATFDPTDELRVTAGVDYQGNRHRVRGTSDQGADPFQAKARERDADFEVAGLFAEATREVGERGRVVLGARADFWRVTDHRASVATGMMGTAPNPTADVERETVLPSGFVRYELDVRPGTTAFAGIGHARRFPDYWELFSKESATTVSAFRTRPERTTQIDLGATHRAGPLTMSVSLFANRIDDFILIESGVAKPAGMMGTRNATVARNIDATTFGGEASVAYTFADGWRADASLAAVRGENETDSLPLAQQPPLEGRLGLSYTAGTWSVGSLLRLVAEQDRFALNQGNIVGQDLGPSDGFAVFSLNAAWRPAAHCQLSVGVDNLFDETYAEHLSRGGSAVAGFPPPTTRVNEPGRTFWAKLEVSF